MNLFTLHHPCSCLDHRTIISHLGFGNSLRSGFPAAVLAVTQYCPQFLPDSNRPVTVSDLSIVSLALGIKSKHFYCVHQGHFLPSFPGFTPAPCISAILTVLHFSLTVFPAWRILLSPLGQLTSICPSDGFGREVFPCPRPRSLINILMALMLFINPCISSFLLEGRD